MLCTRQQLISRWRSRSYVAVLPPDEQAAALKQLEQLLDENADKFHPGSGEGEPVIDVVLRTEVFLARAA